MDAEYFTFTGDCSMKIASWQQSSPNAMPVMPTSCLALFELQRL